MNNTLFLLVFIILIIILALLFSITLQNSKLFFKHEKSIYNGGNNIKKYKGGSFEDLDLSYYQILDLDLENEYDLEDKFILNLYKNFRKIIGEEKLDNLIDNLSSLEEEYNIINTEFKTFVENFLFLKIVKSSINFFFRYFCDQKYRKNKFIEDIEDIEKIQQKEKIKKYLKSREDQFQKSNFNISFQEFLIVNKLNCTNILDNFELLKRLHKKYLEDIGFYEEYYIFKESMKKIVKKLDTKLDTKLDKKQTLEEMLEELGDKSKTEVQTDITETDIILQKRENVARIAKEQKDLEFQQRTSGMKSVTKSDTESDTESDIESDTNTGKVAKINQFEILEKKRADQFKKSSQINFKPIYGTPQIVNPSLISGLDKKDIKLEQKLKKQIEKLEKKNINDSELIKKLIVQMHEQSLQWIV